MNAHRRTKNKTEKKVYDNECTHPNTDFLFRMQSYVQGRNLCLLDKMHFIEKYFLYCV